MPVEDSIHPGDAAAVSMTAVQFGAQCEAGDGSALGTQFVDDLLNLGVGETGRAGHALIITENNGKAPILRGPHCP